MKLSEICVAINGVLNDSEDRSVHRLSTPEDACQESLVLCLKDNGHEPSKPNLERWSLCLSWQTVSRIRLPPLSPLTRRRLSQVYLNYFQRPLQCQRRFTRQRSSIPPPVYIRRSRLTSLCWSLLTLAENVRVFAGSVIGERVDVGIKSTIYPNAVLMDDVSIGAYSIVGPGAIIGYEGFSIDQGEIRPHLGTVVIGEHSSVGANSCVDRGTIGKTQLGAHTHTDNLVQIGHNAKIGDHVLLCGQVGVSGSVTIGDHVMIGGQAALNTALMCPPM